MTEAVNGTPLTQSQLLFWHGTKLRPDDPSYTMVWRFDLFQRIEPRRFADALEFVVNTSDAMSAVFEEREGAVTQRVGAANFELPSILDFSACSNPESKLQGYLKDWVDKPFDLAKGSYRAALVKYAEDHWVWLSAQHHIACDAQSGALLFQAVSDRYMTAKAEAAKSRSFFDAAKRIDAAFQASAPTADGQTPIHQAQTLPYGATRGRTPWSTRVSIDPEKAHIKGFLALAEIGKFRLFTPDLTRLALFLTAYVAFLHRVTGDERVVIGIPSHNRLSAADRETMGLFVEVLPLSVGVSGGDNFESLFARVKEGLGDFLKRARPNAVAHQNTRGGANVLNFVHAQFGTFAGGPASVDWIHSGAHDAHHPLRLHVTDFDGTGLKISLDVNDTVLAIVQAEDVVNHFEQLLSTLADNTALALSQIPLCSEDETARLTQLIHGPSETAVSDQTVLETIQRQVQRDPNAVALREGDRTLSYSDLWLRSGGAAADIADQALPAGPIAVHMCRSLDCIVAILGIMRAGRSFVPVSANTPAHRLRVILEAASAPAAFVDSETLTAVQSAGVQPLRITESTADPEPIVPSKSAYVLFTSGSTGVPKGVVVTQSGLSRYIVWAAKEFGGEGPADYAFFSSLSFDLTITSIFAPLTSGGTLVVYPETGETDLAVLDVLSEDAVDVVKLTPSHLSLVCEAGKHVNRIRTLVLGGENLSRSLCQKARHILSPTIEIINEYGPTEAVVGCMIHRYDPDTDTSPSVPIGRPADGVSLSMRDDALALVPFGVKGEICIGGRLAEGYLGQPDLTAERFVHTEGGQRLYRSGDIGRMKSDGVVEYLGRADQQLKVGGVRIETAEIQNTLLSVAGVKAAHVALPKAKEVREPSHFCTQCGLPDTYPGATFNADGLCMICEGFSSYQDRAQAYFRPEPELEEIVRKASAKSRGEYDAVMLLSGGKDSTYAAYRLAALTSRVLAVTLDNGYISDGAKANIKRVSEHLGWDHRFLTTDKMNEIFVDSLKTHSNVCQGCFKAVYTLGIRTARAEGAPIIVTGLSRGQFFETRLTPELFSNAAPTCAQLENMVIEARRRYHGEDDAVARLLDTADLSDGGFLDEVEVVDLYRYVDVPVSEIYSFLEQQGTWHRPGDTGRSTNCLINDVGIYVHKTREGFHNYALPYSWDVRMGHKTRQEALDELNDDIDQTVVSDILNEIGFGGSIAKEPDAEGIVAYVSTDGTVTDDALWAAIRERLPLETHPAHIVVVDDFALTPNGKIDTLQLPEPAVAKAVVVTPPETPMEHRLAHILAQVIGASEVDRNADVFDLGIDSLSAIKIAMKANEDGIALPATAVFEHRTLMKLAVAAEALPATEDVNGVTDDAVDFGLDDDDFASIARALS